MVKEIEAKFRIDDLAYVKAKLKKIGAELVGTKNQIDTYFVHSVRGELKGVPTYLRVRTVGGRSFSAMHYKLKEYEWEELETSVEDGDVLRRIFNKLGFDIDVEVYKSRETWKIPGGEIVIDTVKNLGIFLEVEVDSREALDAYCQLLGLSLGKGDPLEGKAYPDLLREKISNQ